MYSECSLFCFSGDNAILFYDKNKFSLMYNATKIMSDIENWVDTNSSEINFNKTCYILFSKSKVKNLNTEEPIKIPDMMSKK